MVLTQNIGEWEEQILEQHQITNEAFGMPPQVLAQPGLDSDVRILEGIIGGYCREASAWQE